MAMKWSVQVTTHKCKYPLGFLVLLFAWRKSHILASMPWEHSTSRTFTTLTCINIRGTWNLTEVLQKHDVNQLYPPPQILSTSSLTQRTTYWLLGESSALKAGKGCPWGPWKVSSNIKSITFKIGLLGCNLGHSSLKAIDHSHVSYMYKSPKTCTILVLYNHVTHIHIWFGKIVQCDSYATHCKDLL